jgi:4-hydroxy-tetrahydrodipicolinate synthase
MNDLQSQLRGLWLPLVTPFRDGELDEASLRRLVRHYANSPVDGLVLAATSGEGLSLGMSELERLVTLARSEISGSGRYVPICLGLSGASTAKMQQALDETASWPIDGYLIASPYYTRPSQRGLLHHFSVPRCCNSPRIRTSSASRIAAPTARSRSISCSAGLPASGS